MTLAAATVLEVRNGGSDVNGGGFVTGSSGTDWSLQTAAQYSVADGVTAGTTTITSATAAFGTDVVGNLISVSGGTGTITQGWYQIISRTNATTIVVDRSTGLTVGTGVTLKIGGALASPAVAASIATVAGMISFVKYNAAVYAASSASTNVTGGCVSGTNGTFFCSYDTTRALTNTDANRSTFQIGAAVATATLFGGATGYTVINFILDGNSQTTSIGVSFRGLAWNCKAMNCTAGGFVQNGATPFALFCEATGCSAVAAFGNYSCFFCTAHGNTVVGFASTVQSYYYGCIAYGNTGATTDGFGAGTTCVACVSYANGRDGFRLLNAGNTGFAWTCINCIAESNTGVGFNNQFTTTVRWPLINCGSFGNSSRSTTAGLAILDIGAIIGVSSFFTNAASGDFSLNNTASAGAAARGTGYPQLFPAGLTASRFDVGAAQHADPATDYPTAANVRNGVAYNTGALTGTLVVPAAGDVKSGVVFDNGTTGSYVATGGGHVLGGGV